ncbi:hypothetical protein FS749_009018 [Ceratobasidium sp. UAMH 11750]|nr:hypothetical protein FS749_009018 [Ceratobasidium sp. UAMH 11750]
MYGLVYLRLLDQLSFNNGKFVWKTPSRSWGLKRPTFSWATHDTTTPFHPSGSKSSGGHTPHPADPDRVSDDLRRIARRLMLYPLGE